MQLKLFSHQLVVTLLFLGVDAVSLAGQAEIEAVHDAGSYKNVAKLAEEAVSTGMNIANMVFNPNKEQRRERP